MKLPLDHIALAGYTILFAFSVFKLTDTFSRPVDLAANVLLLIGFASLMTYHYRKINEKKDEESDIMQKRVRVVAHTAITAFFLLTLSPASAATFQFYDAFGLAAHSYLAFAVLKHATQLPGVGLLALHFAFALFWKVPKKQSEMVVLFARSLLLTFFTISFANGVMPLLKQA